MTRVIWTIIPPAVKTSQGSIRRCLEWKTHIENVSKKHFWKCLQKHFRKWPKKHYLSGVTLCQQCLQGEEHKRGQRWRRAQGELWTASCWRTPSLEPEHADMQSPSKDIFCNKNSPGHRRYSFPRPFHWRQTGWCSSCGSRGRRPWGRGGWPRGWSPPCPARRSPSSSRSRGSRNGEWPSCTYYPRWSMMWKTTIIMIHQNCWQKKSLNENLWKELFCIYLLLRPWCSTTRRLNWWVWCRPGHPCNSSAGAVTASTTSSPVPAPDTLHCSGPPKTASEARSGRFLRCMAMYRPIQSHSVVLFSRASGNERGLLSERGGARV